MSKIPATGLETLDYKQPNWNYVLNKNFELVNDAIKKLTMLESGTGTAFPANIDYSNPETLNGSFLKYDAQTGQWEPFRSKSSSSSSQWDAAPTHVRLDHTWGVVTKLPAEYL